MAQPVEGRKGYTYADYLTWDDDKRWEIIEGVAYEKIEGPSIVSDMSPAPSRKHQAIVANLVRKIGTYLMGKSGRIFPAPFDVRFSESGNVTIVQPDLSIFCSNEYLDESGASGAPDWIVEILSPYTLQKDMGLKFQLYEKSGVKEYWIVDPAKKNVSVFISGKNGRYERRSESGENENIFSFVYPDLEINLREIFSL